MQSIALPGSNRQTSQLGFGCSGIMAAMGRRRSLSILETAFDAGVRHFDVAPLYGYGAAEACVGEFAARHAGQITVATKFGLTSPRRSGVLRSLRRLATPLLRQMPHLRGHMRQATARAAAPTRLPFHVSAIRASLEQSLRALRTGSIDLFLLHEIGSTDTIDPDLQGFLEAARQAGKIGAYGCASERSEIMPLHARWPWLCDVLEYNWAPRTLLPGQPGLRVQHRVFAEYLAGTNDVARQQPEMHALSPPQCLLRAALLSNPAGIVLFSSTSAAHIHSCTEAAKQAHLQGPAARLLAAMQAEQCQTP